MKGTLAADPPSEPFLPLTLSVSLNPVNVI